MAIFSPVFYTRPMRENPWHLRNPNYADFRRFQNILDRHQLTMNWLSDLQIKQSGALHHLPRVSGHDVKESYEMLERLTSANVAGDLEKIIDDHLPAEFLDKVHQVVISAQVWSLMGIYERIPAGEKAALKNELERSSFNSGRASCKKRWVGLPEASKNDMRLLVSTLQNSPMENSFLLVRGMSDSVRIEMVECPHFSEHLQTRPFADDLCSLETHWMRGFLYELNTRVVLDYIPCEKRAGKDGLSGAAVGLPKNRCQLTWRFH